MKLATTRQTRRADARTRLSTQETAARLGVKPQTLRAALWRNGEYYGIRPLKSKNRFLRWPAAAVEALTSGEA